jgi:hypothetical protein
VSAPVPPSAASFNWTEEEKQLLRRTLRLRVLEDDRIEVETYERGFDGQSDSVMKMAGLAILAAGLVTYVSTTATPQGLEFTVKWYLAAALPIYIFMFLLELAWPGSTFTVSLLPGTPWCIDHRPLQDRLDMLKRTEAEKQVSRYPMIVLSSELGGLILRTPVFASTGDRARTQKLILDHCLAATSATEDAPDLVARLVGAEVAALPRASYVALQRHLEVVSGASDGFRPGSSPFRQGPIAGPRTRRTRCQRRFSCTTAGGC